MVLTPQERGQLQMLQDQLAQESFHTRLTCALQRGVSRVKENSAASESRARGRSSRSFSTDSQTGNLPRQVTVPLLSRDGVTNHKISPECVGNRYVNVARASPPSPSPPPDLVN